MASHSSLGPPSSSTAAAAAAAPSSSKLSWATALVLLEAASVTGGPVAPAAAAFVSARRSQLERPHDPFTRSAPAQSTAASSLVPAAPVPGPDRKQLVQAVADRFDLDNYEAQSAVEVALRGPADNDNDKGKGKGKGKEGIATELSPDEWDRATAWVFEERMAVIGVVALLLRTHDDESHPCYPLASELLPAILTDSFCPTLLAAFATRTSQSLPEAVRASPAHALFWTRQLVCEQKALLELVFLAFYSPRPARGADLVSVLETIRATEWGQRQHLFGYFDAETQAVVAEVAHLLTIVAVEALNLESAMEQDYPIGAPGEQGVGKESLFAPENLARVNEAVEAVARVDGERSSPIVLGWAFILSKVTTSLLERGVPEAYHTFAERSLRVDVPASGSTARSPRTTTQPLFQLYAAHALSPPAALFPVLVTILQSSLLGNSASPTTGTADPNAVGYLSVLRGLVTSLPHLVRLSFLSSTQLEALYDVFAALYGSPSAALLCAQFWEDQAVVASASSASLADPDLEASLLLLDRTAQSSGESEVVELARSRFPVQFGGLVKLVRALCAGVSGLLPADHLLNGGAGGPLGGDETTTDDEVLAAKCAQTIFAYLATLPTLTHIVPSGPGVTPLPYEAAAYPDPDTGYAFRVVRPLGVSRSVAIPTGTQGRLVSANGSKPIVVAWDFEWSAWRLFADVLEDYAGLGRPGSKRVRADVFGSKEAVTDALPVEWESEKEHERDVTAVLEILRVTLRNDHALAPVLVDHLATAPGHAADEAGTPAPRYDLVEVLFRILERSLAPNSNRPTSTALVSSLIGLIAALLPSFPGVVWTFLRGSTLLFPSQRVTSAYGRSAASFSAAASSPLLQAEKLSGRYPVTLALLSLVHGLVLEDQIAACVSSPEYREVKRGVLVRALKWVRDDVWPVFGSWRFASLADKYALARSCVVLYRLVLEYAQVGAATKVHDPVVQVVTDSFLGPKATVAQLAPALSTLSSGPDGILLLRKAGRYADAQALEDLVDSALGLVLELLRLRRRTKGTSISLLEKLCLTPSGAASYSQSASPATFGFTAVLRGQEPTRRPELLESLTKFVVAPLETRLAVQAAQIVTLLCLASAGAEDGTTAGVRGPISLATLLGGSDGIETIVKALLSVAEDHLVAPELQVAVWDLISSIVDSQPGLAMLLVTGRAYPFSTETEIVLSQTEGKGKAKELTQAEKNAQELAKSLAPKPPRPLPRTAVGVALETVGTWSDVWDKQPAVLAAVLRFFDFVWQHLVDYGTALDDLRSKAPTWEAFVKIAFASTGPEPDAEDAVVAYCHRATARAHAARIVALEIQAAASKPKPEEAVSVKAFFAALADARRTTPILSSIVATSCAPALHSGTYDLVNSAFPHLDLDGLRNPASTHALDEARAFGAGYLFALPLVRRRLDGYMADAEAMAGQDTLDDAIRQIVRLNVNFSLLEAQILDTRSWRQLLETVAPLARSRKDVADASIEAIKLVANEIAGESRGGEVMQTVQVERLSILLVLVQVLASGSAEKVKATVVDLLTSLANAFASESLEPLESITRRSSIAVHSTLLRITFFAVQLVTQHFDPSPGSATLEQKSQLSAATESILRDTLTATRDILVLARASKDATLEQDLALATAVLTQLLRSPFLPAAPVWLAQVHHLDLLRSAFEVVVHMDVDPDGRPLYAHHVLDLCLALATSSPRAAEQLALDGVMTALTNNALTSAAEAGAIALVSPTEPTRTAQHELWTAMLRLVVALVAALGETTRFVEQDVTGFVRLYGQQFVRALEWTSDAPVTLAGLEELGAVVSIMHGIARASAATLAPPAGGPTTTTTTIAASPSSSPVNAVARVFVEQSLHLLQHVVYALLHPNHLAALIEGLTAEERARLDKEAATIADVDRRPIAALVTGQVLRLARDIVEALVAYGDAWITLVRDPVEWRTDRACVALTATVTSSEPASLGTLFDLISYCLDTLRSPPLPTPTTTATTTAAGTVTSLDVASVCSETLESTAVLAVSQLLLHSASLAHSSSSTMTSSLMETDSSHNHPQGGSTVGEKQRALLELASETTELLDKMMMMMMMAPAAAAATAGSASHSAARPTPPTSTPTPPQRRRQLAEVLKARLKVWCAAAGGGGSAGTGGGASAATGGGGSSGGGAADE
ncbi:hypothetical protein JCM3774_002390 [Rhodotorula dairenensis]